MELHSIDNDLPEMMLLRYSNLFRGGRALDLGSGKGANSRFLARIGMKVDAVEQNNEVAEASKKAAEIEGLQVRVIVDDINKFKYKKSYYDLILSAWVVHYFHVDRLPDLFSKLKLSLAPGGYLYLSALTTDDPGLTRMKENQEWTEINNNIFQDRSGHTMHYFDKGELERHFKEYEKIASIYGTVKDYSHGEPHKHGIAEILVRKKL